MRSRLPRYLGRCKSTLVHLWLTTPGWVLYLAAVLGVAAWLAASVNRPVARVELDTSSVQPELGYAYVVKIEWPRATPLIFSPLPDSRLRPTASRLKLYEGNRPLGPAHSSHGMIRKVGVGRYSHRQGYTWPFSRIYFAASDNTDPRTNGRTYRAAYPLSIAPWFDAATILLVLLAFFRAISDRRSRAHRALLAGSRFFLDPALGGRRNPWLWLILGLAAVGIVWLYIFGLWWTGNSTYLSIAGILPMSDSQGFQKCARAFVDLGQIGGCHRRPIDASFFASIWLLSNRHLEITLLLQAALLTICVLIFAKEVARWLGFGAALLVAVAVLLFAQRHAFALSMSENIGLALGLLALALFLNVADRRRLAIAHLGLAVLTVALHARSGAFFVLPFLILWIGYLARKQERSFFLHSAVAVVSVVGATIFNFTLILSLGGDVLASNENFAQVFYGLSVGGTWSVLKHGQPELYASLKEIASGDPAKFAAGIYRLALERIWNDPGIFFVSLLKNAARYHWTILFDYAHGPVRGALWLAWIAGLFVSAFFTRSDPRAALLLAIAFGEMASASVIATAGGARVFAATSSVQPLLAAYALVRIYQSTVLSRLNVSFAASEIPTGRTLRAAYSMLVVIGFAIVLPHSSVRKALAEKPVAGIEECERGYETVVATLHRNAVVLTVRGDTSPTRLWPIRVHYKQLAAGISYNPWLVDFQFESPIQIVQAPQLLENGFATLKRLYWTGRDELPSGPLVRLCVDHSEKRRFGGGRYYRIVSYKVLD